MDGHKAHLLVVDDEEFNRDILNECLSAAGYAVTLAADGEEAWNLLKGGQADFAAVLLDRMMPVLNGMELLARIRSDSRLAHLPVIFQTAAAEPSDVAEGIRAGAYYYLAKPVDLNVMLAVVQNAVCSHDMASRHVEINERWPTVEMIRRVEFRLRTLDEGRALAASMIRFYPDPQRALLGLSELVTNAIEHGNLGISYEEKSGLLQANHWEDEIQRRLSLPENAEKSVSVVLEILPTEIRTIVTDCGNGFGWEKYLEMSPERAFDPNGRGIAMSRMLSFDSVEYLGSGNQVLTVVKR